MLKFLLSLNNLGENYSKIIENIRSGKKTAVFGVPKSGKSHIAGYINLPILYIAPNKVEADIIYNDLNSISGGDVVYLPTKGEVLLSQTAFSKQMYFERLTAIYKILFEKPKAIVTSIEGIMTLFPPKEKFIERVFKIQINDEISLDELSAKFIACGYNRVEEVQTQGEFCIRGDILDVFLIDGNAYRVDFFGDEVETIKRLDIELQKSQDEVNNFIVFPTTDILFDEKDVSTILKKVKFKKGGTADEEERKDRKYNDIALSMQNGKTSYSSELLPLLKGVATVFDYLNPKTVVMFEEISRCYDIAQSLMQEHKSRYTSLFEKGDIIKSQLEQLISYSKLIELTAPYPILSLNEFKTTQKDLILDDLITLKITQVASYQRGNNEIVRDIKNWLRLKYTVVICGKDEQSARNLSKSLIEDGAMATYLANSDKIIEGCVVIPEVLQHGFVLQDQKIAIIGSYDILKKSSRSISTKKGKKDAFLTPHIGDYVVHSIHGIGYLDSVSTIQTGDIIKDYAVVQYKNGDILYLPADQMDSLSKFSGSDTVPKLSKIGGRDFDKVKAMVKTSISKMAINLKELYSKRKNERGYIYPEDSVFQQEFEDDFAFTPTPDQLTCVKEIKSDLTTGKVMDRLLVGDVGYGKTEVAFRAIFKVIESGKQVCMLAPTTILSYQHYQNAMKRFQAFGIRIDYLNRFKSPKNQKTTIEKLQAGNIDLICGTHRMLSKDINFSDLGLLVLDEEQRFGVEHKEKIKTLKGNVNVLSMSATPIPRTLHMSLTGIRDISTIETPPSKRLPVQVMVTEQTNSVMRDAIVKELSRGGQAFVLFNRVQGIYEFASEMQNLMPDVKFIVAHGQMSTAVLEKAIESFVLGEYDVLIATTIIENGIDIPRANTMIVLDSDRLGLSQLYQLKGRVGRSDKLAYVYFMYKVDKVLSGNAYKRLSAITQFTEFGSGFKIAMRDLEIRGSGNILGKEQHGHMEKVGYDMYCKLLKQTLDEIDGITQIADNLCVVEIDLSAYISEDYITLSSARMEAYKLIASISTFEQMQDCINSLIDNYGTLPLEVTNLCKIALIRHGGDKILADKIVISTSQAYIELKMKSMQNEALIDMLDEFKGIATLDVSKSIQIKFNGETKEQNMEIMFDFLKNI